MKPGSIAKLVASYVVWIGAIIAFAILPAPGWVHGMSAVLLLLIWVPYWCYQNRKGGQIAEMFAMLAVGLIILIVFILIGSLEDMIKAFASERMRQPEVWVQNWWKVQLGCEVVWYSAMFAVWQAAPKIKKLIQTKLESIAVV